MDMKRTLLFCLVLANLSFCYSNSYYFRTVDTTDGLADNFVRDIMRDRNGNMWFSTINGLSRYDGYHHYNYMPQELGASTNDINLVRETADSTLWMVCTQEAYTYNHKTNKWQKDGAQRLSKLGIEGSLRLFHVDDRLNLWVTTDMGLYHYDYSEKQLRHFSSSSKLSIIHIASRNGRCFVVSKDYAVYEVSQKERQLVKIGQTSAFTYNRDSRVYLDHHSNLWIYDSHSPADMVWVFSLKDHQWFQPSAINQMTDLLFCAITEDDEGRLWVGSGNKGIQILEYQPDGKNLKLLTNIHAFATHNSHISCMYLDANNTMWVGSGKLGIAFTDLDSPNFNVVSTNQYEDVSSLIRDQKGNLWIGFDGAGVMRKSADNVETHFSASQHQLPSDIVTSLEVLADGSILAGTYGNGIAKFDGSKFVPLYADYPSLKYVKDMTHDSRGNLWVGTVDRGVVKVRSDGRIINYTSENSSLTSNGVICLANDSLSDILYIGTSTGVSAFDCAKDRFINDSELEKLKGVYVSSIIVCSRNILWVGSRNGLWVYRSKDGVLDHLTTEQGMAHNNVRALAKSNGRIWASTDNGLTCIYINHPENDKTTYKCFPLYNSDGLQNTIFSNNAALTDPEGNVLLGSFSGYVVMSEENDIKRNINLQVQFTNFKINGEDAPEFFATHVLQHDERLGIFLSAMVPALSHKTRFLYRFKGEEEWTTAPSNLLYFATLDYGKHILQVKAEIPGLTESKIAELSFEVLPPFWLTKQAIIFYILLFFSLIYLIWRALRNRQKREFAIKQLEINLKKYEVEEDKIRFFTNISHDLKTPLSLVVAPLEKIRKANLPAPIRTELDVAWRNARQLYDLVMELLDFRRLDVGKEKMNLKHGDIVSFVRQTAQGFTYFATLKQINLQLQLPSSPVEINFDENKMRRIITNLMSNAYKYNVDNGNVTVALDVDDQRMELKVTDTGIGVRDKRHIFDRFVQETHGQEQEGSGLGLHIVKQYVDMMAGTISVSDNKPQGSVFSVLIPITKAADLVPGDNTAEDISDTIAEEAVMENGGQEKVTILVVDDNLDARLFLQRSLGEDYNVILASNGKEALQQLNDSDHVDLVISDVMMPVMDGIELFKRIKSDIKYSHIPVIMLTAKSNEEDIIEGLKEGAADYITKPFSLSVLQLRIKKILEWTKHVHDEVATGIEITPSEITVSSLDEELISRIMASIEANMDNMNYTVVQLSNDVYMTRGHLYKKMMAITGKSPLEFIRIMKLKRGKSLIDQGRTNISEVSSMVGLSPKQFSFYFKNIYGETPTYYMKKSKKEHNH